VTAEDKAAATEIDNAHWLRDAPEHAAAFKYEGQELQGVCPACETSIPQGTAACPECGLVVNPEAEMSVCPECDAEVGDEVKKCPNCGVEFE
jgi:predicted amidophosphoribosyltransferase